MVHKYDIISMTETDEGFVLCLPDGSSIEVTQVTIRRSAVLQEAIHASREDTNMFITLPRGILQDWLQSLDALKAAATSPGRGTDIAHNPRLVQFLKVKYYFLHGREWFLVWDRKCGCQHSLLVLLQR